MRKLYIILFFLVSLASPVFADTVDLSVTLDDGVASDAPGDPSTFILTVTNAGPGDATNAVVHFYPAGNIDVTWVCNPDAGSNCAASGSQYIEDTVDILSGENVEYTILSTINQCAAGSIPQTAWVTVGVGDTDIDAGNDSDTDTDTITPRNLACMEADLHGFRIHGTATDGCTREQQGDTSPFAATVSVSCPFEDGVDKCFTIQTATPNNLGSEAEFKMKWEALSAGSACVDLYPAVIPRNVTNFVFPTDLDYYTFPHKVRRLFTTADDDTEVYNIFSNDYVDSPFWKAEQADDCGDPVETACKSAMLVYYACRNNTEAQCTTAGGATTDPIRITVILPDYLGE